MKEQEKFNRELLRGSLDLMVLSVLADGAKYGYLIQKRLREAGGEGLEIQAGTLYPLLHRLHAEGLIRSRWDDSTGRRRKWYDLTAKGRRQLQKQAREWKRYAECISRLLAGLPGPEPA
jgi:PadR family transcriptional regulator, regulatory protein PadR